MDNHYICMWKNCVNDDLQVNQIALNMCWMPGTLKSGLPCEYKSLRMQRLVQLRSNFTSDTAYCESFYDGFLCWGPTPAGHTSYQNCPTARLSDPTQLAFRMCSQNAMWLGRRPDIPSVTGWTNYTPCFPHDVKMLFDKVSEDENAQMKFAIARNTRLLEMVGFSVSLVALLISLFIFTYFRSLRNIRTRIHKNLFSGIVLQVVVRLILYLDQEFVRRQDDQFNEHGLIFGIENMPYICEATYVLLEFSISVMYMWMLIEGLYLSSLVSSNSLKEHVSYLLYLYLGWGIPFMLTAVWAAVAGFHYGAEDVKTCWYGYNFEKTFWIMQAPRWTVIIVEIQSTFSALRATALTSMRRTWRPFPAEVNSIFLMSILRVLIMKMYKSEANEIARIRKAVRAMCFLLPLLGITNGLDMYEPSLSGSVFQFACWSYVSHFLRSFQGFFIALFYCFLNGEVQSVLKKYFSNQRAIRETRRRQSALFRGNGAHTPPSRNRVTFGTLGRNRLFTNTDTNTARIPGRASPHAVVSHTVAIIENERPLQMHQFPCRLADARVMRPDHDSYEADTSI